MRFGLFCSFDNPHRDFSRAYAEQTALVELAERIGFDEAWVVEHHFNADSPAPSIHALLAFLAARTTRLAIGSAATLLPFHNPLRVAEDVATLDVLSGGRLLFGVAKGGPFPLQRRLFGLEADDTRAHMLESLDLVERLLYEENVSFSGARYRIEGATIAPRPLQKPVPVYLATSTPEVVRFAGARGYGFMCGPPFPLNVVARNAAVWREAAGQSAPKLALMRFFHPGATEAGARAEAAELLGPVMAKMKAGTAALQPEWSEWFDVERVLDDSLIGPPGLLREKLAAIEAGIAPQSVVLKPVTPSFERRRAGLELFASACADVALPAG
ncbi:LLM class flavin-dependent oxidoreductase [Methylocella sp.]|uniref:LLM class flavin-dependent oxidoreductase n=1 Tax=Methylocella sp. TaxID=1978226 RepID=UPI0037830435